MTQCGFRSFYIVLRTSSLMVNICFQFTPYESQVLLTDPCILHRVRAMSQHIVAFCNSLQDNIISLNDIWIYGQMIDVNQQWNLQVSNLQISCNDLAWWWGSRTITSLMASRVKYGIDILHATVANGQKYKRTCNILLYPASWQNSKNITPNSSRMSLAGRPETLVRSCTRWISN